MNQTFEQLSNIGRFSVGFDRMFGELHRTAGLRSASNYPPYNIIKESETTYTIDIAVAGFSEEEIEVELINNELTIVGRQFHAEEAAPIEYLYQGLANRGFTRAFVLAENVEVRGASVKNGILSIALTLIVPEEVKAQKIAIMFQK